MTPIATGSQHKICQKGGQGAARKMTFFLLHLFDRKQKLMRAIKPSNLNFEQAHSKVSRLSTVVCLKSKRSISWVTI